MEKIRRIISVALLAVVCTSAIAQDEDIIRAGLLRTHLTISPAYMLVEKQSPFYLHGSIEGYTSDIVSLAGESYIYLGELSSDDDLFEFNHSVFFGASWHFTNKGSDLYIGLQPGIAFTRLNPIDSLQSTSSISNGVNPLFSTIVGYNYYVNKVFHFMLQSRLVLGQHIYNDAKSLAEFRFSAGLGFNINTKQVP